MAKMMTVYELAQAVQRPPNVIYNLINQGNQYRKLKAEKVKGQWNVYASEVHEFPFNADRQAQLKYAQELKSLKQSVALLEYSVAEIERKMQTNLTPLGGNSEE